MTAPLADVRTRWSPSAGLQDALAEGEPSLLVLMRWCACCSWSRVPRWLACCSRGVPCRRSWPSGPGPTIVVREGRPWVAIGTPGGHTIGQTVRQMLMNLVDFRMDIAQAIAAPRVSFVEPNQLAVESGIPEAGRRELEATGHAVRVGGGLGNATGLTIEYDPSGRAVRSTGAADPRGQRRAIGY